MARPSIVEAVPRPLSDTELLARVFRVFGDATRIRIIELLLERPHIQKEIVETVGLSQGQVSQHLACMTWCGLIEATKVGRVVQYQLASPRVVVVIDTANALLESSRGAIGSCRVEE